MLFVLPAAVLVVSEFYYRGRARALARAAVRGEKPWDGAPLMFPAAAGLLLLALVNLLSRGGLTPTLVVGEVLIALGAATAICLAPAAPRGVLERMMQARSPLLPSPSRLALLAARRPLPHALAVVPGANELRRVRERRPGAALRPWSHDRRPCRLRALLGLPEDLVQPM
jgi:hypothetical protein